MKTETRDRNAELAKLGFSLTHAVPMPGVDDDREGGPGWPHIAYKVTLLYKNKPVLHTPYCLGVGNVDWKKANPDSVVNRWTDSERSLIYTYQKYPQAVFKDKHLWARVAVKLAIQQKFKPSLADVMQSLLSDGEPFFNAQSLEEWAGELGYDKDSRKAESIWKACDAVGRQLANKVDAEALAQASEIVRDL